jgi:hypothetical protein
MSTQSLNLGLTIWNAANDQFDWTLLANNFSIIDQQFAAAGTQTVSNVPIRFIETLSTVPSTGNTDGRLVYLTAANGGFSANTIIQYKTSTTSWYEVGQPELVTQVPPSNHYLGRMIVFTASSGSFVTGDVAVCTDVSGVYTFPGGIFVKAGVHYGQLDGNASVRLSSGASATVSGYNYGANVLAGAGYETASGLRVGYTFYNDIGDLAGADFGLLYVGAKF